MTSATCPTHAAAHPKLWQPDNAPCPFANCPNGTPDREWTSPDGVRYLKSIDYIPATWQRCFSVVAVCGENEGS